MNIPAGEILDGRYRVVRLLAGLIHPGLPSVSDHFVGKSGWQFLIMGSIDSKTASTYLFLSRCYGEQGSLRQAIEALEQAAKLDSRSPDPLYWIGVYYLNANKRKQARSALEQALRISKNLPACPGIARKSVIALAYSVTMR